MAERDYQRQTKGILKEFGNRLKTDPFALRVFKQFGLDTGRAVRSQSSSGKFNGIRWHVGDGRQLTTISDRLKEQDRLKGVSSFAESAARSEYVQTKSKKGRASTILSLRRPGRVVDAEDDEDDAPTALGYKTLLGYS